MKLEEVKENLNKMVVYKGAADIYRLTACIIRKNKDEGYFYQAELFDTKNRKSVVNCRLDDIKVEV